MFTEMFRKYTINVQHKLSRKMNKKKKEKEKKNKHKDLGPNKIL